MFPIIRRYTLNRTFNCSYCPTFLISKTYYCDKKEILEKIKKGNTSIQKANTSEETKIPAFEDEAQILQTVMLEKEKDANVRSRLSKECNKLLDKKVRLSSTGLNLHLEQSTTNNICWEDYMFDKTVDNLKKHTTATAGKAKGMCKGISSVSKLAHSGDSGSTASTNRIIRGEPGKVIVYMFLKLSCNVKKLRFKFFSK